MSVWLLLCMFKTFCNTRVFFLNINELNIVVNLKLV